MCLYRDRDRAGDRGGDRAYDRDRRRRERGRDGRSYSRSRSRSRSGDRNKDSRKSGGDGEKSEAKKEAEKEPEGTIKRITLKEILTANPGIAMPDAISRLNAYNTAAVSGYIPPAVIAAAVPSLLPPGMALGDLTRPPIPSGASFDHTFSTSSFLSHNLSYEILR